MTASAKGTVEKPGESVRQKAGLNRAILDATPGSFLSFLATESGRGCLRVDRAGPAQHRPSQTDPVCGEVRKKALSEREHRPAGRPGDRARPGGGAGDAGRGIEAQRPGTGLGRETGNSRQSGLSRSAGVVHMEHRLRLVGGSSAGATSRRSSPRSSARSSRPAAACPTRQPDRGAAPGARLHRAARDADRARGARAGAGADLGEDVLGRPAGPAALAEEPAPGLDAAGCRRAGDPRREVDRLRARLEAVYAELGLERRRSEEPSEQVDRLTRPCTRWRWTTCAWKRLRRLAEHPVERRDTRADRAGAEEDSRRASRLMSRFKVRRARMLVSRSVRKRSIASTMARRRASS